MLLWQHKNRLKAHFCFQLISFVFVLHLIALICVLLQSNFDYDELHIDASMSYDGGADVMVVPFFNSPPEPAQMIEPEQAAIMPVKKETTLASFDKLRSLPKGSDESLRTGGEKGKTEQSIKEPEVLQKTEVAQTEKQGDVAIANKVEKAHKDASKEAASEKNVPKVQKKISTNELRALNIQQAIAQQLNLHWQPPAGFADDVQATVAITLTYNGEVDDITMKESSGVPAFDIHARSTLYAMEFPRACWGKKITITFS